MAFHGICLFRGTTKIDHLPYYYLERKYFNKLAWSDAGVCCLDYLYFFFNFILLSCLTIKKYFTVAIITVMQ